MNIIICGTGHRPNKLGGYSDEAFNHFVGIASNWLATRENVTVVISGMALGWDQALAQAAINLKRELWAYIPCRGQTSRWNRESKERWERIKDQASRIHYSHNGPYTGPECMHQRNIDMVNDSDEVLAMWNGTPGGTANCLNYAKMKGKPIHNLFHKF